MKGIRGAGAVNTPFLFATCQVGAEGVLKKELTQLGLKFAFSRPGFLTFKSPEGDFSWSYELNSIFARSFGISLGFVRRNEIHLILQKAQEITHCSNKRIRLHAWERDRYAPGEEPLGYVPGAWLGSVPHELRKAGPGIFSDTEEAQAGDLVFDLIAVDEDQIWMGVHWHSSFHSRWPGGKKGIELPSDAPSRAYLKIEEVLDWSGALLRPQDTAVEVGSAPGGASFALLRRGLRVVGIDPAVMDPQILRQTQFLHVQKPVNQVLREELPSRVDWFLLDMNVEPRITLYAVDRLISRMQDSLLGVFLTVKLNTWKVADQLPSILEHVRAMGMVKVKVAQLSYHRKEVVIFGLTRKGLVKGEGR